LLKLVENPNHKRAKYVDLTDAGKKVYLNLDAKQIPWAQEGADRLTEEELKCTLSALKKIAEAYGDS